MKSDERLGDGPSARNDEASGFAANVAPLDTQLIVYRDLATSMADTIKLFGDLYLPGHDGVADLGAKYNTLLLRTPYGRKTPDQLTTAKFYTARGYAVFIQDVRGTGGSEGEFEPMLNESWGKNEDGADTLSWLIRQPWSNGKVVMAGPSYLGGVQLLLAAMNPPGLETAFVQAPAIDLFAGNLVYGDGGAMALLAAAPWADMMAPSIAARAGPVAPHEAAAWDQDFPDFRAFALSTQNVALRELPSLSKIAFWTEWLDNWDNPAFFEASNAVPRLSGLRKPLMLFGGWHDLFLNNTINAYAAIVRNAATPDARIRSQLIIGPWAHGMACEGARVFPGANVDHVALGAAWIDHRLAGGAAPLETPVTLYIMGENRWRSETSWPPTGFVLTRYYLHGDGRANGANGGGVLRADLPDGHQAPDRYQSDPAKPVPSMGGRSLVGGSVDQRPIESRDDVLVYTTPVLEEEVEVTGEVSATLYASTMGTDTDWYVRLVDVFPDGAAYDVASGHLRARYRAGRTVPQAVTPGEIVEYRISLWSTSNVFKMGHRIRVHISSTDFPNFDVNPNAFVDMTRVKPEHHVVAAQTVYHDDTQASFVELPIIPNERARDWIETPFPGREFDLSTFFTSTVWPVIRDKAELPSAS